MHTRRLAGANIAMMARSKLGATDGGTPNRERRRTHAEPFLAVARAKPQRRTNCVFDDVLLHILLHVDRLDLRLKRLRHCAA